MALYCANTWTLELSPQHDPLSCLNREEKETIEICFEENTACHAALANVTPAPAPEWELVALGLAVGFLGGMVLDAQLHHTGP